MKKMNWLMVFLLAGGVFVSCSKDNETSPAVSVSVQEAKVSLTADPSVAVSQTDFLFRDAVPQKFGEGSLLKSSNSVLSATSYAQIPVGFYKIYSGYRNSYVHMKQPDGVSCSWTSYVISAACIYNCAVTEEYWAKVAAGNYAIPRERYPLTAQKVYAVRDACIARFGSASAAGVITSLHWYAGNYDVDKLYSLQKSFASRFEAVRYLLYWTSTYATPTVVVSTYYGATSKIGHYRIVCSINWTGAESTSTVYFTDPIQNPTVAGSSVLADNVRSCSLAAFMDMMIDYPKYYNFQFLAPIFGSGGAVITVPLFSLVFYLWYDGLMIQKVRTYTHLGLQGFEIVVEIDSNNSLPSIEIIGLPDTAIKESKERLRATFRHVGIAMPNRKFVLNLAPSDLRKVGTSFDMPMAVAMLMEIFPERVHPYEHLDQSLFFGELGLDGSIKGVSGLLPCVIHAMRHGYRHFFVPAENLYELEYVPGIVVYPVAHFGQMVSYLLDGKALPCHREPRNIEDLYYQEGGFEVDFGQIKGHGFAKRALAIAAAGGHNILMVGAPGSGKTLLSKALQGILPPLGFEEILEVSQVYSVVGKLNKELPLITRRPFRQVHHTASKISIVGGGSRLTPGEVSLAHKGILFFDELTEFPREVLEVLRQPLEDKVITISRVTGTLQYPASFMFVASMNPCVCGYYKDREKQCTCSYQEIKRYQSKISGPLLDRIDMMLEIPRENIGQLLEKREEESSGVIREKVMRAWKIQQERFAGTGISSNASMDSKYLDQHLLLDPACKEFLTQAAQQFTLSPRVVHRMIKLARTIADMEGNESLRVQDLAEALQYRNKSFFIEGE